ncbi:cadherin-like beta sandwich domain-containing protein [Eubacterium sp. MSJ-21]|nr:cadherin-like beta sandwich domain-containing protein [Eubacterium sp. MSJ-21]
MKQILKRGLAIITALILCLNYGKIDVKAADVVIALSASTVSVGNNVTATISVSGSEISAYTIYVSYNSSVLQYNSASGSAIVNGGGGTVTASGTAAGSFSISFTAIANGSGSITTSGSDVYDINGNAVSISHAGATVTVETTTTEDNKSTTEDGKTTDTTETTEENGRSADCDLESLQVSPGTLTPSFSPDRTSYSLQVDEDVTSVVVSAATADSKATTNVSGANSIQKGKNTVRVTVTAENGAVKVYTISVQAGEDVGDPIATIDGKDYTFVMSEDGLDAPEGFTAGTTAYKDWDVLSYQSPNKKLTVVCLKDGEGEKHWFIMDAGEDVFTPYQEYSSQYNRYIITAVPEGTELPKGFAETMLRIGENQVVAYQSADVADKDIYLVYAINVEGEEGFYEYDAREQAFIRYVPVVVSEQVLVQATPTMATPDVPVQTPAEKSPFTNPLVIGIIIASAFVIIILLVCVIIFAGRISKQHKEMLDAEDMIAQLANANKDVNPELLKKLGLEEPEISEEPATPQSETSDEKLADEMIEKLEDNDKPEIQETEKTADSSDLEQTSEIPQVDGSILSPEVNALVEEVNRDFQTSMAGGEAYVEKSEKELAHEDYEKRSMEINNRIMTNYDSQKDSVFSDDAQPRDPESK